MKSIVLVVVAAACLLIVLPIVSCGGCKSGSSVQVCTPNHPHAAKGDQR